jgi:hypothetical protein
VRVLLGLHARPRTRVSLDCSGTCGFSSLSGWAGPWACLVGSVRPPLGLRVRGPLGDLLVLVLTLQGLRARPWTFVSLGFSGTYASPGFPCWVCAPALGLSCPWVARGLSGSRALPVGPARPSSGSRVLGPLGDLRVPGLVDWPLGQNLALGPACYFRAFLALVLLGSRPSWPSACLALEPAWLSSFLTLESGWLSSLPASGHPPTPRGACVATASGVSFRLPTPRGATWRRPRGNYIPTIPAANCSPGVPAQCLAVEVGGQYVTPIAVKRWRSQHHTW